jgi:hypothetical protein
MRGPHGQGDWDMGFNFDFNAQRPSARPAGQQIRDLGSIFRGTKVEPTASPATFLGNAAEVAEQPGNAAVSTAYDAAPAQVFSEAPDMRAAIQDAATPAPAQPAAKPSLLERMAAKQGGKDPMAVLRQQREAAQPRVAEGGGAGAAAEVAPKQSMREALMERVSAARNTPGEQVVDVLNLNRPHGEGVAKEANGALGSLMNKAAEGSGLVGRITNGAGGSATNQVAEGAKEIGKVGSGLAELLAKVVRK